MSVSVRQLRVKPLPMNVSVCQRHDKALPSNVTVCQRGDKAFARLLSPSFFLSVVDGGLCGVMARLVEAGGAQFVGPVLLGDEVGWIVVGVQIAVAISQLFHE